MKWFKSYFSDHEQITNFKGNKSHSLIIKMGVPQGSILGPLLFSIYVNSMPNCTTNGIVDMYAHKWSHCKWSWAKTNLRAEWSYYVDYQKTGSSLISDKTCVMVIGSRANLKKIESFTVYINTTLLNRVHSANCLGVLIDDELNCSSHVDKVYKTSQRNISVIRRAKSYLPENSLKLLYNSLVLPQSSHMDYCSAVWSNRYQSQTTQLRTVQKGQQD